MSVVMGYVKDGIVYMATDTRIVNGDTKINELGETNYKIRKLDNGILYCATSSKYFRQFVRRFEDDLFTLNKKGELNVEHIVKEILPLLYYKIKEEGFLDNDKDDLPYMDSSILIAFKGRLFEICSDFSVCEYTKYQSIGRMSDYSLSQVSKINTEEDINRQLVKALKDCAQNTEYVGGPYLTINTKDMLYELWEEE